MTLRYNNIYPLAISLGINIWFVFKKRTLYVEDLENVSEVRFTEEDKKQDIFEIALYQDIGSTNFKNGTVNSDQNYVLVQHYGKELIDKVFIPKGRKDEKTITQLFDEDDLLNDPFSAPTSLDHSWHSADIRGLTGIKWELEDNKDSINEFILVTEPPIPNMTSSKRFFKKAKEVAKKIFDFISKFNR